MGRYPAKDNLDAPEPGVVKKEPTTVDDLLDGLQTAQREIVVKMRKVVRKTLPDALESVKWGQPVYSLRGKNIICFMMYDDHVNYGLFMGARLRSRRLEGTGKGLRHLKLYKKEDVDEQILAELAREAASLV